MPRTSANPTRVAEIRAEKARAKAAGETGKSWKTTDSFQNFVAKIGIGTDNLSSAGTYGFNPITRERTLLEWIHRGAWIAGLAVDCVADDATRAGVEVLGDLKPEDLEAIEQEAQVLNIWQGIRDTCAWARLYGGAVCIALIDGQDYSTPLRVDSVGRGQFRGVLSLDRWMLDSSITDLITEPGPNMGLPKYYTPFENAPGLRRVKIHHSRVIRMEGNRLPYWQRVVENLWGQSILERLYDRLIAFDSTTQGAAQLVYKSYIRTYAVKNLRDIIASGGDAMNGLAQYVAMMAQFQSIEGITLLDADDKFEAQTQAAFAGLTEVLVHLGQQISGAVQVPLVRLFGQSPVGLNATGDADMRTYYDMISQLQNRELRLGVTSYYRMLAQSLGIKPDKGFGIKFRPLWLLSETDRASIAAQVTTAVSAGIDMGVPQQVALKELRQSATVTGIWSNITDEDIKNAEAEVAPPVEVEVATVRAEGQAKAAEERANTRPEFKPNGKAPEAAAAK